MSDDVYPNYYLPTEPLEQTIERKKERALALEGMDFLKEMVVRLEERIAYYEGVSSIPDEVRVEPDKFIIIHNTHTMLSKVLRSEKEYLEDIISQYKK